MFLAQAAAQTSRIRLGTGIVTLPLELPIRVAEDAAVLDLMCGGRLEVGVGPGGNLSAFTAFGLDSAERTALLVRHHRVLLDAWAGRPLPGGDRLYPPNPGLVDRIWQATFNVEGARRAGAAGDGLMLSRTQPRPAEAPRPVAARHPEPDDRRLSRGAAAGPRAAHPGLAHRVRRRRPQRRRCGWPKSGWRGMRARYAAIGRTAFVEGMSVHDLIAAMDVHIGTPDEVIASLRDRQRAGPRHRPDRAVAFDRSAASLHPALDRAGGRAVAPALGWVRNDEAAARHVA